jgi:hypothetical protein
LVGYALSIFSGYILQTVHLVYQRTFQLSRFTLLIIFSQILSRLQPNTHWTLWCDRPTPLFENTDMNHPLGDIDLEIADYGERLDRTMAKVSGALLTGNLVSAPSDSLAC